MRLQQIEIAGFKSFAKKATLSFNTAVTSVVGPNGSGKSNVVEAFRFVLGEQSMKSMRGKSGADLIFRGGTGAPKLSRAAVSITFDNSDKIFAFQGGSNESEGKSPVLFDTITFTREIFADGTSKYSMNGTEIRLKQMIELLSSVNIGTSSHHIISQGEADGILRANTRDRREMLEDALGLKIYHYRIKESEQKLIKTKENLKEVASLRRELAPHITFLKKQVEKVEKAQGIRDELQASLLRFLATEKELLQHDDQSLKETLDLIERRKADLEKRLALIPEEQQTDTFAPQIESLKRQAHALTNERRLLENKSAKLEGVIEAHQSIRTPAKTMEGSVSFRDGEYRLLVQEVELAVRMIREADTIELAKKALSKLETVLEKLKVREHKLESDELVKENNESLRDMVIELEGLQKDLEILIKKETSLMDELFAVETARTAHFQATQSGAQERYNIKNELTQCNAELQVIAVSKNAFLERKERFDQELKEAGFLFGVSFLHELQKTNAEHELPLADIRRTIDRLKIRLEENSGIGNDVVQEYQSTKERDEFLTRELLDIENSVKNLELLVIDLKKVLDEKFTTGVKVINERFGEFFKTMFGGGSAFLSVTMEKKRKRKSAEDETDFELEDEADESFERGIDVHVNLPEKKVKELQMLSGGERSLVSIALLFAISQVNPPPFLVLDETDAALDEANSRRYGDMVERLSEYSQLIVVTHNRETMSRASVLYGVTLGPDSGSKLLSIKFDEAVKVAK